MDAVRYAGALALAFAAGCAAPAPSALPGWRAGDGIPIPHWFSLKSPSGKDLLDESPSRYPHHCALWIADKVQLGDGPIVDYYHRTSERSAITPASEARWATQDDRSMFTATLRWVTDGTPVLDDERKLVFTMLEAGEYLFDLEWTLRAAYGDVSFHSDAVHYAWPYLRLHPQFSVEHGGALVDDQGRSGQAATNLRHANWVDASASIDGVTEGVAVFLPQDGEWRKFVTRDYGIIGPRRADARSGKPFVLARGESLGGRVRIFVHRGDATSGKVAARYREYVAGR
ncbi:MAG: PmoA family protein [Planctomycetes bacterium]|nr:PmoA family protein [Planctomycetota bacterium]